MAAVPQPGVVPDAAAQLVAFRAALGRIGLSHDAPIGVINVFFYWLWG